jgi:RNA polymerase sigma-70 factor, ECF subfamily
VPDEPLEVLIREARGRSREAQGFLFELFRPELRRLAGRLVGIDLSAKVGASDLVQETFLDAQRDFPTFQGRTHEELAAWLRAILRHTLANFAEKYRRTRMRDVGREASLDAAAEQCAGLATDSPAPVERLIAAEQAADLDTAFRRLPAHYQEVIRLRHREGLSFAEVGAALGQSLDAARQRWLRAVQRFRRELGRGT